MGYDALQTFSTTEKPLCLTVCVCVFTNRLKCRINRKTFIANQKKISISQMLVFFFFFQIDEKISMETQMVNKNSVSEVY